MTDRVVWLEYAALALVVMLPLLRPGYILTFDMVFVPQLAWPAEVGSSYLFQVALYLLNLALPSWVIQKLMLFGILMLSGVGAHRLVQSSKLKVQNLKLLYGQEISSGEVQSSKFKVQNVSEPKQLLTFNFELLNATPWGAYFAGILYMINPFTYQRFMDGQYAVLLGYALMPFFVRALLRFLDIDQAPGVSSRGTRGIHGEFDVTQAGHRSFGSAQDDRLILRIKSAIGAALTPGLKLAFWTLAISIVSIHSIGFMVLLTAVSMVVTAWQYRHKRWEFLRLERSGVLVLGLVLLASSYWLVPLVQGTNKTTALIEQFDARHLVAFRTAGDDQLGVVGNVAALYGYWGEREDRYVLPKEQMPAWIVIIVIIWGLVIGGLVNCWRRIPLPAGTGRRDKTGLVLAVAAVIAGVLAIGIAWPPLAGLNGWLVSHVPLFAGYREPQKFVALIALAYAYLGARGVDGLLWQVQNLKFKVQNLGQLKLLTFNFALLTFLVLPLLYTPTMLWGFSGQLRSVDYPPEWYEANQFFVADSADFKILFLPWHQYLSFPFTGRIIVNPAQRFFAKPVLAGDNAEIGLIARQVANPTSSYIENDILAVAGSISDAGRRLSLIGVKYVVLAKTIDIEQHQWLDQQKELKLIIDNQSLRVYQNLEFTGDVD